MSVGTRVYTIRERTRRPRPATAKNKLENDPTRPSTIRSRAARRFNYRCLKHKASQTQNFPKIQRQTKPDYSNTPLPPPLARVNRKSRRPHTSAGEGARLVIRRAFSFSKIIFSTAATQSMVPESPTPRSLAPSGIDLVS